MATQVFVINAAADLKVGIAGAADAGYASLSAGDKEVNFIANGKRSVDLDAAEVVRVTSYDYDAGTAQVSQIDLGAVSGSVFYVKLINTTLGTMNLPMKTFEVTAASAGAAATAIVADMTAEFAKSGSEFAGFSASVANTDQVVVTAPINSSFRIAGSEGGVITYTTSMEPSTGEADDVTALYDQYAGYDGITNRVGFPVKRPTSPVVAATNYDIVVVEAVAKAGSKDGMSAQKGELIKLIFAVDSSDAAISNGGTAPLATELTTWIG
jgi:hypothetical protein